MGIIAGILMAAGGICVLVASIVILIAAFKESAVQGLLVLFVPFYVLYYAFKKMENPGIWPKVLIGGIGLYIVSFILTAFAAKSAMSEMEGPPAMPEGMEMPSGQGDMAPQGQ